MAVMQDMATRLREARKRKGLSARALADAAGLTPTHVSMIESRRKGVRDGLSSETLRRLCHVLDVSIDWLVTGKAAEHGAPKSLPPTGT
jgi:transcriptional regulator with XRE-family HTH domain